LGKPFPMTCEGILETRSNGAEYHLAPEDKGQSSFECIACTGTIAEISSKYALKYTLKEKEIAQLLKTCSVGKPCRIVGYMNGLTHDVYFWVKIEAMTGDRVLLPPRTSSNTGLQSSEGSISVQMKKEGGTYVVPVLINNAITLDFLLDSGASDVSVPADVFSTLVRTGSIKSSDITGKQTYVLADGSKLQSPTFIIRSLKVGDTFIENVRGSVASPEGSLLLGQSFLERFRSWSIDNANHKLHLTKSE
jgi:clan AA aspartic protease (TIGR02281 family)